MNVKEFIEECRKRTIFRTISIYAVSAWLFIQIAATTFPFLGLPKIAVTIVIICVFLGLPIIMILSWFYSVRTEEKGNFILRPDEANPNQIKNSLFQKVYFSITLLISIGVIFVVSSLVSQNFFSIPTSEPTIQYSDTNDNRITIEPFQNKTGDPTLNIIGEMAADRIEHSITQNNLATVVSNSVYKEYDEIFKKGRESGKETPNVSSYLSIDTRITGNYYLDGDNLLFDCSIVNAQDGELKDALATIRTLKIKPLEAIDRIKQSILGYIATKSATPHLFIETHTPKYEAYKNLLLKNEDPDNELQYLEKAIEIDPNYFEPKLLRLSHYYNDGQYETVDSLYNQLRQESLQADDRQKNLLSFYNSLIRGNNRLIYNYFLKEYNLAPFHLPSNSTMMVLALQFVNKPDQTLQFYNDIPIEGLDIESCKVCQTRAYVNAMALMQMNEYQAAIIELEQLIRINDKQTYNTLLIKAYIRTRSWRKIEEIISHKTSVSPEGLSGIYATVGKECILINEEERALDYFQKAVKVSSENTEPIVLGEAHYYLKNYNEAKSYFTKTKQQDQGNDIDIYAWLASTAYKLEDETSALGYIESLNSLLTEYQFGTIDYALAKIQIAKGDEDAALTFLQKSVADGMRYKSDLFSNDPFFAEIRESSKFKTVLTHWY